MINEFLEYSTSVITKNGDKIIISLTTKIIVVFIIGLIGFILKKPIQYFFSIIFNKYRIYKKNKLIKQKVRNYSKKQLLKIMNSHKYIPDTYINVSGIKQKLRLFTEPIIFYPMLIDRLYKLNFKFLNQRLDQLKMERFTWNPNFKKTINQKAIDSEIFKLNKWLEKKENKIIQIDTERNNNEYWVKEFTWTFKNKIQTIKENFSILDKKIFLLTGDAGQGKTNFLTDFSLNYFNKKHLDYFFLLGSELEDLLPNESIVDFLIRKINPKKDIEIKDFYNFIENYSKKKKNFYFIFDGINENTKPAIINRKLDEFLSTVLDYNNIKVIISCRKQFFDIYYSSILSSSYANEILIVENLNLNLQDKEKTKLFEAYFEYFNISISSISSSAYKMLTNDFLLLRIFSEANKNQKNINLQTIHKRNIFNFYIFEKSKDLKTQFPSLDLIDICMKIISYMINKDVYKNIPIDVFLIETGIDKDILVKFLDGNILLRLDIRTSKADSNILECINITFDEFRDYLISYYITEIVYKKNKEEAEELIKKKLDEDKPFFEGVSKFLFSMAREDDKKFIYQIISQQGWYNKYYYRYILEIEDSLINPDDFEKIHNEIEKGANHYFIIYNIITQRYDETFFKNLNISYLLKIILSMDEKLYEIRIIPLFKVDNKYKTINTIGNNVNGFINRLSGILNNELDNIMYFEKLFQFLICLLDDRLYFFANNEAMTFINTLKRNHNHLFNKIFGFKFTSNNQYIQKNINKFNEF